MMKIQSYAEGKWHFGSWNGLGHSRVPCLTIVKSSPSNVVTCCSVIPFGRWSSSSELTMRPRSCELLAAQSSEAKVRSSKG